MYVEVHRRGVENMRKDNTVQARGRGAAQPDLATGQPYPIESLHYTEQMNSNRPCGEHERFVWHLARMARLKPTA